MSDLWSRRNVTATILVGILTCAVTVGVFWFGSQDQEIGTQIDTTGTSSESSTPTSPTIAIVSIHVSEVAMDIPASFELGIQAGGATNLAVQDTTVVLYFGRAEIESCDYTPKSAIVNVVADERSYRRLEIVKLRQEEILHIRCLISAPVFEQVIITGGNIFREVSIDFEQYQASERRESVGFWNGLFRFFILFFTGMFCLKVIGYLFSD